MPPLSIILPTATTRRFFFPKQFCLFHRFLSTASPTIEYSLSHPIYTIWGANTGVGKTLVSVGIAASFFSPPPSHSTKFVYVKPVQTGFPSDSDSHFVYSKFSDIFHHWKSQFNVFASNHTLKVSIPAAKHVLGERGIGNDNEIIGECDSGFWDLGCYEERKLQSEGAGPVSELICKTMYGWREAISPHLAAQRENAVVGDEILLEMLKRCLGIGLEGKDDFGEDGSSCFSLIETAGGVASPGPSGSLQCDLYRPFRLPAILVGDGRLGGILGTISAYESLKF